MAINKANMNQSLNLGQPASWLSSYSFRAHGDTSLLVLSAGWLALCTGLVVKHMELLTVFVAFCASFVLAGIHSSLVFTSFTDAAIIRNHVGIWVNGVALWTLACHEKWWPDERNCDNSDALFLPTFSKSVSPEFVTLSLAAGFLAFDHWYTALYCQPPPKPLAKVIEDAISLSALAIILAVVPVVTLVRFRSVIGAWLVYKIVSLSSSNASTVQQASISNVTPQQSPQVVATCQVQHRSSLEQAVNKNYWYIHGRAYDLRLFVERHPGGAEALRLGQGRDCTALVQSYHPFSLGQVQQTLKKFKVVTEDDVHAKTIQKNHKTKSKTQWPEDKFYEVLVQRVEATLKAQGFDPRQDRAANTSRVLYYIVVATAVLLSGAGHVKANFIGSIGFAMSGWLIGACGHDAGHFAASRSARVNDIGVWCMSLLCNPMLWQHQHTYAHHSFTNDFDADPDLHHFHALLRVHRQFQHHGIYENQIYLPFVVLAYSLVVFGECVWIPFGMLREGSLYGLVEWTDKQRPLRSFGMMAHLLAYITLVLVAPFRAAGWPRALLCVAMHVAISGLLFGFFSQINHLNEASLENQLSVSKRHPDARHSWAANQIETSNNFCPTSVLWYYFSNGLNLQIEHHLFPCLNHCHLWRIQPTVQATCAEYGVAYKSWSSWGALWNATRSWLDKLAVPVAKQGEFPVATRSQVTSTVGPSR